MSAPHESDIGQGKIVQRESIIMEAAQSHGSRVSLESLPSDIRRHILCCLGVHELSAIVQASPVYHAQYLEDRRHLLSSSLQRTLGSAAVDVFAVHDCNIPTTDCQEYISEFMKTYQENTHERCLPSDDKHSLDDIISVVRYHLDIVTPLVDLFTTSILANLGQQAGFGISSPAQEHALTRSEAMRVIRAIYRFQLLCQVTNRDDFDDTRDPRPNDSAQTLFNVLESWEVEEVFAFFQWAMGKYAQFAETVWCDLHPDNPKFADQSLGYPPDGSFEWGEWNADDCYQGLTLRGLRLLHTVMFKIDDHEHLVSVIEKNIHYSYAMIHTDDGILGEPDQWMRYRYHPTECDHLQKSQAKLPFRGDNEPGAPPLAWTIMWGGTYSSLYGHFASEDGRRCGYVFWDAATLEWDGRLQAVKRMKAWDIRDEWDGFNLRRV